MCIVPITIGMNNHIHIIWQVKDIDTSEVQKQFLEGCSKHIK